MSGDSLTTSGVSDRLKAAAFVRFGNALLDCGEDYSSL